MSRRAVISKLFVSENALNTSLQSEVLNVRQTDGGSIHLVWANGSSADFTVTVEARNGEADQDSFRTLDFGSPIQISGASGSHEIIFNSLPFAEMRLVLTRTAGSADIDATFTFKSLGN